MKGPKEEFFALSGVTLESPFLGSGRGSLSIRLIRGRSVRQHVVADVQDVDPVRKLALAVRPCLDFLKSQFFSRQKVASGLKKVGLLCPTKSKSGTRNPAESAPSVDRLPAQGTAELNLPVVGPGTSRGTRSWTKGSR